MKAPPKRKRAFKANDLAEVLVVKITRREKNILRVIAAGSSLSFAVRKVIIYWEGFCTECEQLRPACICQKKS